MSRREKLEQLLLSEPDDAFLNFGLAMEHVKEEAFESALASFDRVLEIDPSYAAACYHKGQTLARAGRTDEAIAVLRSGIQTCAAADPHAASEMQELIATLE